MRLIPFAIVGVILEALGLALSSGILAFLGAAVLAVGVGWFVLTGTGTRLGAEAVRRR